MLNCPTVNCPAAKNPRTDQKHMMDIIHLGLHKFVIRPSNYREFYLLENELFSRHFIEENLFHDEKMVAVQILSVFRATARNGSILKKIEYNCQQFGMHLFNQFCLKNLVRLLLHIPNVAYK